MPIQDNFDEENFDCFIDQYKSRSKYLKFSTGHTYRNLKRKDYNNFNKDGFVGETTNFSVQERLEFENGTELILTKKLKGESNKNNLNDRSLIYSMNKKKRWLLPDLLKEKTNEMIETQSQNGLAVFYHEKSYENKLFGYFDSTGKIIKNKRIDYKSIDSEIFNIRGWRSRQFRARNRARREKKKRLVDLKKYFNRKRRQFKNGNRNRNSGIKRHNEAFISLNNNEDNLGVFNNVNVFKYFFSFILPHMRYKTCKSWRSGLKSFPGKYQEDYGVRKDIHYGYYMRRKTKVLIKHSVKHKKNNEMFNFTKYALSDDNVGYYEKIDYINHESSHKIKQSYLNKKVVFDFNIQTNPKIKIKKTKRIRKFDLNDNYSYSNIIEVSEDDHLFFKYIKIRPKDKNEEVKETNQEPNSNTTQSISLNDTFFSKFQINVNDKLKFADSIKNSNKSSEIVLVQYSYPKKLIIKLDNLIKERYELNLNVYLIFDLIDSSQIFDFMYVNIDFNEKVTQMQDRFKDLMLAECLNDKFIYENLANLIDNFINTLAKFFELYQKDLIVDDHFYNNNSKREDCNYLIGEISSIDQISLNKMIEKLLNKSEYNSFNENSVDIINNHQIIEAKKFVTCEICYDDLEWPCDFVRLEECGHNACIKCWQEYIKTKISNMKVTTSFNKNETNDSDVKTLTCLNDKCSVNLSSSFLNAIISSKLVKKYIEFYTDLTVIRNRTKYVYCKNSLCKKILVINENRLNLVTICECGYMLCNFCLMDMHFPALCNQANEYFKFIQELKEIHATDETELYTSEGKNCPNCGNYMEKNMGCNHMSCVCGFQFCWLCLQDFYANHNSSTGYACRLKPVKMTTYDSSNFINLKKSRFKNSKNYLSDIMDQYRKIKKDINVKYSLKQGFRRIALQTLNQLVKSNAFNENTIHLLFKHLDIDINSNYIINKVSNSLNKLFSEIEIHLNQLNNIIEYLALFLNYKNNINFRISKYSFKPNLKNSLKKAIYLYTKIKELVTSKQNNEDVVNNVLKLILLDLKVINFVKNLKHIFVNTLKIYQNC
jgi:hypothetical protein